MQSNSGKQRKREYYEIHNTIDNYHYGLCHLLRLSDYPRPVHQIIHDLFFTKGVLSDELHIEEEVDITGEVEKYQPVKVSRDDIPLTKTSTKEETSQDDGLTQMCGGYTIDELHNALREEHDNPGSTALKDVMKLYE